MEYGVHRDGASLQCLGAGGGNVSPLPMSRQVITLGRWVTATLTRLVLPLLSFRAFRFPFVYFSSLTFFSLIVFAFCLTLTLFLYLHLFLNHYILFPFFFHCISFIYFSFFILCLFPVLIPHSFITHPVLTSLCLFDLYMSNGYLYFAAVSLSTLFLSYLFLCILLLLFVLGRFLLPHPLFLV